MSGEHTFEIRLPDGRVFVRYRGRSEDFRFSVMLQAHTAEGWRTVCLIDNAEDKGTHIHRYVGMRKLPGKPFHQGSAREGVPVASDYLRAHAHDILESWRNDS